jgi:hypothetical protein
MRTGIVFVLLLLLAGCGTTRPEWLANRATCTVAGDTGYITSMWGVIGIASVIDARDVAVICPPR